MKISDPVLSLWFDDVVEARGFLTLCSVASSSADTETRARLDEVRCETYLAFGASSSPIPVGLTQRVPVRVPERVLRFVVFASDGLDRARWAVVIAVRARMARLVGEVVSC